MATQFKIGDSVVCPSYGVGEVTAIEKRQIGGDAKPFYIIQICDSNMKFMVPADGSSTAGVRTVVGTREVKEIYRILKASGTSDKADRKRWTKRCRRYMDMLRSGSALQIAEVLRDLLSLSGQKELSFAEKKILESARTMLVKELAIASEKPISAVNKAIDRIFCVKAKELSQ